MRTKHIFVLIHIRNKGEVGNPNHISDGRYHKTSLSPPEEIYFSDRSKAGLLLWILFVIYVLCLSCFLVCSLQPCGHLLGRAGLLALLCVVFSCIFVTFPCGVLGQVWYLIPDLCLLSYFGTSVPNRAL